MSSTQLSQETRNGQAENKHIFCQILNRCYQITPAASTPPNAWCRFLTLNNSKKLRSSNLRQIFLYFKMFQFQEMKYDKTESRFQVPSLNPSAKVHQSQILDRKVRIWTQTGH